jgi:hypothetical protein
MLSVPELQLGFRDAENYKRKENKELFNHLFVRTPELDQLCEPSTYFLIGEKGAGKTAYAVYLENNDYHDTAASLRYIRETDYAKFVEMKQSRHLSLSDYTNIWKVVIYLLIAENIYLKELKNSTWSKYIKYRNLKTAIDKYYHNAFSPEIIYAIKFAEESEITAQLLATIGSSGAKHKQALSFTRSHFQINLMYIQRQFEDALRSLKLNRHHVLLIDGIDVRPGEIPYEVYLECVKGLANAIWAINNDFFSGIKDSKGRMRVVLLLRPDIFDSLELQNQNSKLRDNSVVLNWLTTYSEYRTSNLFHMSDRLLAFQQNEQCIAGEAWEYYFPFDTPNLDDRHASPSSFISFLRFSQYRPRDILGMLAILKENFIEQRRPKREVFREYELSDPMFTRKYTDYLLGEVKDHLSFYYPANDWDKFMKFFQFLHGHWSFTYDDFLSAYKEFHTFLIHNQMEIPLFASTPDIMLQFLFDLAILCYIAEANDRNFYGWCFRERTATNISPRVRTNVRYEIHFGVRKALDLGKYFRR